MVQKQTAAVHTVRNLGVHLGMAEDGGWVRADLQHTLSIGPNPGGIDWVQRASMVFSNALPRQVTTQEG